MSDLERRSQIELSIDRLMRRDPISRRTFMGRAGKGGLAVGALFTLPGLLAACAPGPGGSGGDGSKLAWLNWPAYIDISEDETSYPSIEAFTEQTGIEVEYDEGLLDNADFLAQYAPDLRAGNNTGWDVMSPGGWVVERMARLGWLEELDHSKLPNWTANVADYAKDLWFDPDNKYSVWWQGGITGIAYDPEMTGREVTTFDDLLDPAFSGQGRRLQRHARHVRAHAPVPRRRAGERHRRRRAAGSGQAAWACRTATSAASTETSTTTRWRPGTSRSAWPGPGDISQMNLYDNDKVVFIVPESGGMRWNDNLVIPKGGANLENAHKLLNYWYDPAAATMLSEYVGYFTPVKGVDELIAADAETARARRRHRDGRPVRRARADRGADRGSDGEHLHRQAADRGRGGGVERPLRAGPRRVTSRLSRPHHHPRRSERAR